MVSMTNLSSKGQVTLPKRVREYLGVESGDTIIFELVDQQLVIRKAKNIENYFNSLPPLNKPFKRELDEKIASTVWERE